MAAAHGVQLVVVGAGPAGVAAALTAADHGLDVVLVDRARFPRDKTCGDGLTTGALRALEALGVDGAAIGVRDAAVRAAVLRSPTGRVVELPLPDDGVHAAVVARRDLDRALVATARRRGVDVREGRAVTGLDARTDAVTVHLDHGEAVTAPFVVAADGHYSPVRRMVEPGAPALGEWHAMRQYFCDVDDDRLSVVFDADLLPGYAWVFPLGDGRANVGFGVLRGPGRGREHRRTWAGLTDRPGVRAALGSRARPDGPARAWPIPTAYDPVRLVARGSPRVLFAGDAAGVVDPMTGEGIAQALVTGALAARVVAARVGADPRRVSEEYRRRAHRELGRDLRFAALLQRVLAAPAGAELALRAVDASDWTRRSFARWMFEDYPRAMLLTPGRWRRTMLHGPGAYRAPAA